MNSSSFPKKYRDFFIQVAEEVTSSLMNYMGAKASTYNAAPRLTIVLVKFSSDLLSDDALLIVLFEIL